MIELLIDLVGTRLRHPPVPVVLLNTLAMVCLFIKSYFRKKILLFQIFDTNTTFSQKHKDEQLPTTRSYKLEDDEFLKLNSTNQNESFGWIRSFIQRVS